MLKWCRSEEEQRGCFSRNCSFGFHFSTSSSVSSSYHFSLVSSNSTVIVHNDSDFIILLYQVRDFLRYTISFCTTGWKGLICNRKLSICKDMMVEINFVPPIFLYEYYRKMQNDIVVICEMKCMKWFRYCRRGRRKIFPDNIHRANYYFTHSKKQIIPLDYRWVVLCTILP
jgi:hypothetical protein